MTGRGRWQNAEIGRNIFEVDADPKEGVVVNRLPLIIVISTVWFYWGSVVFMILRSRFKFGASSGAVPRTTRERMMWMVWVPTVIGWLILPALAYTSSHPLLRAFGWTADQPVQLINWLAVIVAMLAYALTVPCWLTLKENWSLAVVPDKPSELITHGFYARIRHPIYAFGILLLMATIVVAPSPAMLLAGIAHIILVLLKSGSEERFLREQHGRAYGEYCERSGRYLPWPMKLGRCSTVR
jgi:protein-S-isoprenylcysteine O-methyltransferase Ste14